MGVTDAVNAVIYGPAEAFARYQVILRSGAERRVESVSIRV